jgi:hypothetical protein
MSMSRGPCGPAVELRKIACGKHSITYVFFARPIGESLLLSLTCASSDPEGNADVRLTLCNRAPNLRVPTMRTAIRLVGPEQVDPHPSATERRNTACERGRRSMQTSTCAWSLGPGLFHSLLSARRVVSR